MNRREINREIEEHFGLVPTMFKLIPDDTLEMEWKLFRKIELEDGPIPQKYRELIGIGISAVEKCRYCELFHTEMARLQGATEEEINNAVHYAKNSAGWSTFLNGLQVDFDKFKSEIRQAGDYVKTQKMKTKSKVKA